METLREKYLRKRQEHADLCREIERDDPIMAASARRILNIRSPVDHHPRDGDKDQAQDVD